MDTDRTARKLAALTGGRLSLDTVHVGNGVALVVHDTRIELCRTNPGSHPTYEDFAPGLTFKQIAEHALAVANLRPGQSLPALGQGYAAWTVAA